MIDLAVAEVEPLLGTAPACRVLGASRASLYRRRTPPRPRPPRPRAAPARALSDVEREAVLCHLRSERFVDCAPAQVWATLLDEGTYLASERTMYRLLHANGEVSERRNQLTHPPYERPELLAERPNEVWSWDISKLKGPAKWTYFYLYVVLDVFSRYTVGWTVQQRESAALAEALIAQAVEQQQVGRDQLTVHADRGSSMTSKPVAMLLSDLGVTKTHSRPYTSTDNPYSEAQFKTARPHRSSTTTAPASSPPSRPSTTTPWKSTSAKAAPATSNGTSQPRSPTSTHPGDGANALRRRLLASPTPLLVVE